jgi:hypothetical protein
MSRSLTTWRAILNAVFGPVERFLDKRRRKKSFRRPVICGHGRDALRYYENGHFVVIEAELMCSEIDRKIWRSSVLKWDDSGERLSEADAARVVHNLCGHLDHGKVRWKFGDTN